MSEKKLSIAAVRRLLYVGRLVHIKYVGVNSVYARSAGHEGLRKVERQTKYQMVSIHLDGERKGMPVYCRWDGVKAKEISNGNIQLWQDDDMQPFVEISFPQCVSIDETTGEQRLPLPLDDNPEGRIAV